MPNTRILVSAFACLPDGSAEDCVGWNWITQLALHHEVWVLVNAKRQQPILEAHLAHSPIPNVRWIFLSVPDWLEPLSSFEQTGYIRYNAWQIVAFRHARRLHRELHFDAVHHITYVQYWSGSWMSRLPTAFIWGPVGGGEVAPKSFYESFGHKGRFYERTRDLVRSLANLHPAVRHNARFARLALATTDETARSLRALGARNVQIMPAIRLSLAEFEQISSIPRSRTKGFRVLSAGRIVHWKGFYLGVRAFARLLDDFPDCEYWLVGDGSDESRIRSIARELGVENRIRWFGRLPRRQLYHLLATADVLLHPSLHESGGYICLEAMAASLPVVCFDLGGPAILVNADAGIKVPAVNPEQSVADLTHALAVLAGNPEFRARLGANAAQHVRANLVWSSQGNQLRDLYSTILETSPSTNQGAPSQP